MFDTDPNGDPPWVCPTSHCSLSISRKWGPLTQGPDPHRSLSSSRETLSKCRCSRRPSAASMTQRQVRLGPAAPPGSGDTMRPSVALWMVPPQEAVGREGADWGDLSSKFRAVASTLLPGTWPQDGLCPPGSPQRTGPFLGYPHR